MKSAEPIHSTLRTAQRFAGPEQAGAALAERLETIIDYGVRRRDRASLLVPGGQTPIPLFEALRDRPLAWSQVHVSLTDERRVPADHPDSNARQVRAQLLRGRAAAARFHPLYEPTGGDRADEAACGAALGLMPRPFDGVVLGMGRDGHIASLFPDDPALPLALSPRTESRCLLTRAPVPPTERLSLTLATLLQSRWIALFIQGGDKWATLEAAMASADATRFPVYALLSQRWVPVHVYHAA